MDLTIKAHRWQERGENCVSHFFPFINGNPETKIANCTFCTHYRMENPCSVARHLGEEGDHLHYSFCGNICGYFNPNQKAIDVLTINREDLNFDQKLPEGMAESE